jgi:hypothetical protein
MPLMPRAWTSSQSGMRGPSRCAASPPRLLQPGCLGRAAARSGNASGWVGRAEPVPPSRQQVAGVFPAARWCRPCSLSPSWWWACLSSCSCLCRSQSKRCEAAVTRQQQWRQDQGRHCALLCSCVRSHVLRMGQHTECKPPAVAGAVLAPCRCARCPCSFPRCMSSLGAASC